MNWLTDFGIPNKHFTKIHSVRDKLLHADRQRDVMKLKGDFCNCFYNGYKKTKNKDSNHIQKCYNTSTQLSKPWIP